MTRQGRPNDAAVCFARAEQLGMPRRKPTRVQESPAANVDSVADPSALRQLGGQLEATGQLDDAIRTYQRCVALGIFPVDIDRLPPAVAQFAKDSTCSIRMPDGGAKVPLPAIRRMDAPP